MIVKGTEKDIITVTKLMSKLWKGVEEKEVKRVIESKVSEVFLYCYNEEAIGFAQVGLRNDYVEGTKCSPVGYLEGIYIKEKYRLRGYARELVKVCEEWAKCNGCDEFASDCELFNEDSLKFHKKVGFKEANRIICFNKKI